MECLGGLGSLGSLGRLGKLGSLGRLGNLGNLGYLGNLGNLGGLGGLGKRGKVRSSSLRPYKRGRNVQNFLQPRLPILSKPRFPPGFSKSPIREHEMSKIFPRVPQVSLPS